MKLGYLYKVKEDATQDGRHLKRFFCFGHSTGRYLGLLPQGFVHFSHSNGVESCINCANPDDILEEVGE